MSILEPTSVQMTHKNQALAQPGDTRSGLNVFSRLITSADTAAAFTPALSRPAIPEAANPPKGH